MDSWIDYDDGKIDYQHRYIDDDTDRWWWDRKLTWIVNDDITLSIVFSLTSVKKKRLKSYVNI